MDKIIISMASAIYKENRWLEKIKFLNLHFILDKKLTQAKPVRSDSLIWNAPKPIFSTAESTVYVTFQNKKKIKLA